MKLLIKACSPRRAMSSALNDTVRKPNRVAKNYPWIIAFSHGGQG